MQAAVGNRIIIPGRCVGQPVRDCLVLEVKGANGNAPYLVRWGDNGHEGTFYPGNDAKVQHFEHDAGGPT